MYASTPDWPASLHVGTASVRARLRIANAVCAEKMQDRIRALRHQPTDLCRQHAQRHVKGAVSG